MDHQAKREIADAILATAKLRASSWDGADYTITYAEAADQAGLIPAWHRLSSRCCRAAFAILRNGPTASRRRIRPSPRAPESKRPRTMRSAA